MKLLHSPARIGTLELKNHAVMSPMVTNTALRDGCPSEATICYYAERARGGIGMIIVEGTDIERTHCNSGANRLAIADKINVAAFERLTRRVHAYGTKVIAQLMQPGGASGPMPDGSTPWGVSEVPFTPASRPPHAMTTEEVKLTIQEFGAAALRAKAAGFDGVEIHAAHSYLLGEFLAPYYNNRTDCYGGSFENRMRIFREIYDAIRAAVGPRYTVGVRMSGDELTPDIPGTLNLEDGIAIAKELDRIGFDYINVSNGNAFNPNANCDPYSYQPGWKKHIAASIHAAVKAPVLATNTVKDPEWAEKLLEDDVCDLVVLGRSQFADPEFINKSAAGDAPIRRCIGCMYCRERLIGGMPVRCTVNPRMGCEVDYPAPAKDGDGRKVVVIGGGPAGMEAAIVLSERGFDVTLMEKGSVLGGTLNLAEKPPFKEKLTGLKETMIRELELSGVKVLLGTCADADKIRAIAPEAVFLAGGASPVIPPLPGMDSAKVVTAEKLLRDGFDRISGKAAVIGSGLTGLETAEILAEKGVGVTVYEMQDAIAPGMFPVIKNDITKRLTAAGAVLCTGCALTGVTDDGITIRKGEESLEVACDHVILALGVRPDLTLYHELQEAGFAPLLLGDCGSGGRIADAIRTGFDAAYSLK